MLSRLGIAGLVMLVTLALLILLDAQRRHCSTCCRDFAVFPGKRCWACWRQARAKVAELRDALRRPYRRRGS